MTNVSKRPKWVLGSCICPLGRNRAPFRSTIDGFRDIGNRSFGRVIIGDFREERLKTAKMGFGHLHIPSGSKSSSVSLYDRRFSRYQQSKFRASEIGDFHDEHLKTSKMGLGQLDMSLGSKSSSVSLYDR